MIEMGEEVILFGAGGHAKVVADALEDSGARIVSVIDTFHSGRFFGVEKQKVYQAENQPQARVVIAIGDNAARKRIAGMVQHSFANAVHRSAIISRYARLGVGVMVLHGSIVQADASIGNHVILNSGSQVDHDCQIADFVHIAPGAVLCGSVSVGVGTLVGAGASILPGVKIGAWVVVGAGAVVTSDVPDGATVIGVPAKVVKQKHVSL